VSSTRKINVLIVDDSAFMRRAIAKMLEKEPDFVVVGTASSGEEAVKLVQSSQADVITMDVEMPGMGGLEAARAIVERHGPPIIMISALTREGAETTLRALEIGVVDFIPKPDSAYIDILKVQRDLVEKLRHFGARTAYLRAMHAQTPLAEPPPRNIAKPVTPVVAPPPVRVARAGHYACVALGTSTGGPVALSQILPSLPHAFPIPIVVVQHMPPGFTKPLAERLNAASKITVVEAQAGMRLAPATAYVAPAGFQLTLQRVAGGVEIRLSQDHAKSLHVPSVDVMAASVGEAFGGASLGVILTGMGHDGVAGLKVIKERGGFVIGQDEGTSVVYGMPRAAAIAGLVDLVVPLPAIARTLCDLTGLGAIS
jgi:two-component system chemotaxis response regulator CheB